MSGTAGVLHINDSDFEQKVLKSDMPVLVDFWAPWCGPCRALAPVLDSLAQDFTGRVIIAKINVDDNTSNASVYGVNTIPSMIFFKNGKIIDTIVGLVSKERLQSFIDKCIQ